MAFDPVAESYPLSLLLLVVVVVKKDVDVVVVEKDDVDVVVVELVVVEEEWGIGEVGEKEYMMETKNAALERSRNRR